MCINVVLVMANAMRWVCGMSVWCGVVRIARAVLKARWANHTRAVQQGNACLVFVLVKAEGRGVFLGQDVLVGWDWCVC
jgi:hypothetical protein